MRLPITLSSAAEGDVIEAFTWYSGKGPAIAADFVSAIDESLESIAQNPTTFPTVHPGVRRTLARRFPYGVFYRIEATKVVVIAVFHLSRNPKSWKLR